MADVKTKKNRANVKKFLDGVQDERKRRDCFELLDLMREATGHEPAMWGPSIVGFGSYHYKYATGREGDWPLTGFSPRKQNITLYIMPGFDRYEPLMKKLGKHSTGKSCLYIKRLEDIDLPTLKELVRLSADHISRAYQ